MYNKFRAMKGYSGPTVIICSLKLYKLYTWGCNFTPLVPEKYSKKIDKSFFWYFWNFLISGNFKDDDVYVGEFWLILQSLTDKQKRQFLKFVTSCSRPPLLGFSVSFVCLFLNLFLIQEPPDIWGHFPTIGKSRKMSGYSLRLGWAREPFTWIVFISSLWT